jgi:hypothetical protein
MSVSIREYPNATTGALRDITKGVGLQTPILVVPRRGFWLYINRYYITQHFVVVTPDGAIYEEQHPEDCTDLEVQFGALLRHIAEKYSVDIPDTPTLFEYWAGEYRDLNSAIYRYDSGNRGWKNDRINV